MEIIEICPGVHRITAYYGEGGSVFLYLLRGDRVALVDTGTASSPREFLQPALAELGLDLSRIDLILNTHAHLDHVGGNQEVKQASNAKIHVHALDLALAKSTEAQVEFMTAPLRALGLPAVEMEQRAAFVRKMAGRAAGADVSIEGGDVVDLGGRLKLRVLHTPGHTPGCASYFCESEGLLFSGDAVQGMGGRPGDTPYYFDAPAYRRSLGALATLDLRILAMSHAYFIDGLPSDATQRGPAAKRFLGDAMQIADTFDRTTRDVVGRMRGASKLDMAQAVIRELLYRYPLLLVRETQLPRSAGPTLLAHIEAALAGDDSGKGDA